MDVLQMTFVGPDLADVGLLATRGFHVDLS